tara:strand:+ start:27 stop:812 length:786 start_codon:yes stop_codon:yes gene_type:complete
MTQTKKNSKINNTKYNKTKSNKTKSNKIYSLAKFIHKKLKHENVIVFNETNKDKINYKDKKTNTFFNKLVDILNFSFEKEREYQINKGGYYPGYKHNIDTIKNNLHSSNFDTYILTTKKMVPISLLYVEKNENDFDKIWTVCTDNKFRGKGMSSKLINFMIVKQLNDKNKNRNTMLLEVYNDHIISRKEKDVKQSQIMGLFGSKGFVNTDPKTLSEYSFNNLLSNDGQTKIMVFNPKLWIQKNPKENRKLNLTANKFIQSL